METKQEYVKRVSKQYTRRDLLKACRAIGLTAHKLDTNEKLAEMIYIAKNQ